MKKTVIRFLSLMLCLVLAASLAACGKTGGEESRPEPVSTASEPVSYAYKSDFLSIDSDSKWGLSPVVYTDDGFYATGNVLVGRKEPPEGTTEEYEGQFDIYGTMLYFVGNDGKGQRLPNYV
ncbi:MAG: hypothetical protein IJS11_02340, partial [Oscillospiraceae bacterium]|nr:hypothetical protein [Oscillospiraceae bacterium]